MSGRCVCEARHSPEQDKGRTPRAQASGAASAFAVWLLRSLSPCKRASTSGVPGQAGKAQRVCHVEFDVITDKLGRTANSASCQRACLALYLRSASVTCAAMPCLTHT